MTQRSRYDELHDKYQAILTTKAGTRYERLAALVFKALQENNVVIHDVSLIGASDVAHQIDVHVTAGGVERRVAIECKDFDVSGDKVGLDVVRNFWAVIEDTRIDEAFILTCNGFTREAAKFAKSKGIKLAILRAFKEEDWLGRIRTVVVRLTALLPANPIITIHVPEADLPRFQAAAQTLIQPGGIHINDNVFMVKDQQTIHFNDYYSREMSKAIPFRETPEKLTIRLRSDGWKLKIGNEEPLNFDGVEIVYNVEKHETEIAVTSDRIAELILSGFGDNDVIVFGDQLERQKIEPNSGEVL